jgi:hemerythrin superfamily protein
MLRDMLAGAPGNEDVNAAPDAIELLKRDHRLVEALFKDYEAGKDGRTKAGIAKRVCAELDLHAKAEEKSFYPAIAQQVKKAEDLVDEAFVEHAGMKRLVKEIQTIGAGDDMLDARMKVLKEYVRHHVHEEEHELFPKVEKSDIDLAVLGEKLMATKERLQKSAQRAGTRAAKGNGKGRRTSRARARR